MKPTLFFSVEILHIFDLKKNLSTYQGCYFVQIMPSNVPLEKKKMLPLLSMVEMVVDLYNARGPQDATSQKRHIKSCYCVVTSAFVFEQFCRKEL